MTVEAFDMAVRTDENWGAEAWRAPDLDEGDTLLFDECGRVLRYSNDREVDCRSHYFRVVRAKYGRTFLLVKHGGGQERVGLFLAQAVLLEGIGAMTSDQRYLLLHTMLNIAHDAARQAGTQAANRYCTAFVEGRLKKRKRPGQESYKVWIEGERA